jgi:septum formation protein
MRPLILASASPRRKELLGLLGLPFEVVPSAYQEPSPETHPDPRAFAEHLAGEKALDVARRHAGALVLGADTVVALGDRLYGKPAGPEDAARMLAELSGRTHRVITGVALAEGGAGGSVERFSSVTEVTFRPLDPAEIHEYVGTGEPLDKAGAYAIQGFGSLLIEAICGDYPNVVGLPLTPLALRLRARGFRVMGCAGDGMRG